MSRRDLATIVEHQKQQIGHYENKLRDVVRAYKALQVERDALQVGLDAYSAASVSPEPTEATAVASSITSTSAISSTSSGSDQTNPHNGNADRHQSETKRDQTETSVDGQAVEKIDSSVSNKGNAKQFQNDAKEIDQTTGTSSLESNTINSKNIVATVSETQNASEDNAGSITNSQLKGTDSLAKVEDTGELLSNGGSSRGKSAVELQHQLKRVTQALTSITVEKDKLHKSFMVERKTWGEDKEKVSRELDSERKSHSAARSGAQELRQKLQSLQADRDADADDAAIRLRECQRVLSEHREARERAELHLQQTQHKLLQRSMQQKLQQHQDVQQHQQNKQIAELKNVVCQLESRLSESEAQVKHTVAELDQVHQLHAASATTLHQESVRAQEAEAELSRVLTGSREREAGLESRLAEAANCLASSTSAAFDSAALQHYKLRVRELTELNQELSSRNQVSSAPFDNDDGSSNKSTDANAQEVDYLVKQLKKLWLQLQLMPVSASLRSQLEDMLGGSDVLHDTCRQQQNSLMQQLLHLQQQHSSRSSSSSSRSKSRSPPNSRLPSASTQYSEYEALRRELRSVASGAQVTEAAHTAQIAQLKQECRSVRADGDERMMSAQQSHRAVVCSLEQQLTSQRLHSIATLQERDVELHRLQKQLHSLSLENAQQSKIPAALLCSTSIAAAGRSGPLLHHVEELQRREQQVASLQQEKRQLQQALREMQHAALEKRMQQEDRLDQLEMQLERHSRNQSRSSQNLEYLKNVLLHFLTSGEGTIYSKKAMVKAVAAVLQLNPQEEEKLKKQYMGSESWWK
uniref:GRIP and coiled-coil domain-containing protein 1-like n=1 Tax=Hirondellea gigas TaxID=1518452 RepID=A0A2P2HZ50_9CRUS